MKPKNLLFDNFSASLFPGNLGVFVLCKNIDDLESSSYLVQIKNKFSSDTSRFIPISGIFIGNEHIDSEDGYDIVIPSETYDMDASVKKAYERYALWHMKFKYYVIHEHTYGYVRLATKFDLFYRLYLRKPVLILSALIGIIPIAIITAAILMYDFLKKKVINAKTF